MNREQRLRNASKAYYTTGEIVMTDEEFDRELKLLQQEDPNNPFLTEIRTKENDAVPLPIYLPSLEKATTADDLRRWKNRGNRENEVIIEHKLDGITVLWHPRTRTVYTGGDGINGRDISHLSMIINRGITIDEDDDIYVRGEFVLKKTSPLITGGKLARNIVAGLVNRKRIDFDWKEIDFIAYECLYTNKSILPFEQFEKLENLGYKVVAGSIGDPSFTAEVLTKIFDDAIENAMYQIDGLVLVSNRIPNEIELGTNGQVKNPKEKVAWKGRTNEETERSVVINVEWNVTGRGILIPTIIIRPVVVQGATINRASGFNAKWIVDNDLKIGTIVSVKRSGGVGSFVEVIETPNNAQDCFPEEEYVWDTVNIVLVDKDTDDVKIAALEKSLKDLEVDKVGPAMVRNLYTHGFKTIREIYKATANDFKNNLERCGIKTAENVWNGLRHSQGSWNLVTFMIASGTFDRGIGKSKLSLLFDGMSLEEILGSVNELSKRSIHGLPTKTIEQLLSKLPAFVEWYNTVLDLPEFVVAGGGATGNVMADRIPIVITGGKKGLPADFEQHYDIRPSVTKAVHFVVYSGTLTETGKVSDARKYGIPIVSLQELLAM